MKSIQKILGNIFDFVDKRHYIFLLIVMLVAAYNVFKGLDAAPIQDWDEARHGVNAYEMLRNRNYIVNTYDGVNDYWNLKPPVSYWFIILGYKILGYNALGLRFYSAISALVTIFVIWLFVKKRHGNIAALISAAALTTNLQYITSHCARTGDADSLFVLFFTISIISMILIDKNMKFLYSAGFFFSMAFLTKSWHSAVVVAIGGLYMIGTGLITRLRIKEWIMFLISTAAPIFLWAILRFANDGFTFLTTMVSYDLLKRTTEPIEGHVGDAWFYIDMIRSLYYYWLIILASGFISYLAVTNEKLSKERRAYTFAITLWILVPLLAFTRAETKLLWYIMPIYPAMAICIGAFISKLIRGQHRNAALQIVLSTAVLVSTYKSEESIRKDIREYNSDKIQNTLMKLERRDEFKGNNIYKEGQWNQSVYLAALLYGDLYPKESGIEGFFEDKHSNSLLLVVKEEKYYKMIQEKSLKIVIDDGTNYILRK